MANNTAASTNEYSDASVDDILAEYQLEQRSAAAQARYDAFMEAEPEYEENAVHIDDEGVKVYKPKKSAAVPTAPADDFMAEPIAPESDYGAKFISSEEDFQIDNQQTEYCTEDSGFYEQQDDSAYYEPQDDPAYYEPQGDSAYYEQQDDSAYYGQQDDSGYYEQQDDSGYYEQQNDSGYYEQQNDSGYYEQQENPAYYEEQETPAYYEQQENPDYYEQQENPDYYEQQENPAYYEEQENPGYYEQQENPDYYEEQDGDYAAAADEYYPEDEAPGFLSAEDFGPEDAEDIDPRFNLSGERKAAMVYGGRELDISPEENYIPPSSPYSIPVEPDMDDYEEEPAEEEKPARKSLFGRGRKKHRKAAPEEAPAGPEEEEEPEEIPEGSFSGTFSDAPPEYEGPAEYAEKDDYSRDEDYGDEEEAGFDEYPEAGRRNSAAAKYREDDDFPSFGQFVLEFFTGLLYHLRTSAEASASTMEDSSEDLGRELSPMKASKYYGSHVHSLRLRMQISFVLLIIMGYITLGFPMTGMLKTLPVQAAVILGCQLCIMLLGLDVLTGAAMNLVRGRFGADCLAVFMCILTSFDALSVALEAFGDAHTPLCLLSSLSFCGILFSSLLSARGLRKALRVPAIGKRVYAVTGEAGIKGSGLTLLKSVRHTNGFVRRTEEAPPDETFFAKLSPLLLALCILLALVIAAVHKSWSNYLYILTAMLTPAVPLTALLCFALPFFFGSMRIFSSGASIAGWSGLCDIGSSKNLIVTDRDLFPQGSVEIENILILDDLSSEKVISYAGTMLAASDSGIASCFVRLMEKNGCPMKTVENFECMAGGGFKGIIDGETVLCGSLELMRLMNVHVPYRKLGKTPVLLAVNGILYGIFNMKYTAQPQVRKALVSLIRSNRHPIFAVRDFNITPEMLREHFDVATDGYDFPPYVERFPISEAKPGESSKISAVVCREGLGPLTHMADTGRSMYVATRVNILLTLLCAVIGILAVFVKLLSAGAAGAGFMLIYLLLWFVPVAASSFLLKY